MLEVYIASSPKAFTAVEASIDIEIMKGATTLVKEKLIGDIASIPYDLKLELNKFLIGTFSYGVFYSIQFFEGKYSDDAVSIFATSYDYTNRIGIKFSEKGFISKFRGKPHKDIYIIMQEELIKEVYKLSRKLSCPEDYDAKIWNVAASMEATSFYGFTSTIGPKDFRFPENLSAVAYYKLLCDIANEDGCKDEETESITNANSSKSSTNEATDKLEAITAKMEIYLSEDVLDVLKAEAESEGISEETIEVSTKIQEHTVQDKVDKLASISNSKVIGKAFAVIERYIKAVESTMTIVKSHKENSYAKYSWKTASRSDGILYPGKVKVAGGAERKYVESPIVFFDFSGSTLPINDKLNALIVEFWRSGWICCTYNTHLKDVFSPSEIVTKSHSAGGTMSHRSVQEYFAIDGHENKDGNIYIITDGDESYRNLFEDYPKAKIFQLMPLGRDFTINLIEYDTKSGKKSSKVIYEKGQGR